MATFSPSGREGYRFGRGSRVSYAVRASVGCEPLLWSHIKAALCLQAVPFQTGTIIGRVKRSVDGDGLSGVSVGHGVEAFEPGEKFPAAADDLAVAYQPERRGLRRVENLHAFRPAESEVRVEGDDDHRRSLVLRMNLCFDYAIPLRHCR